MVAVIDYGLGNLASVANMIKEIGFKAQVTSVAEEVRDASHIILPGVGAFDAGMHNLEKNGMDQVIKEVSKMGKPILGICLGMQLLGNSSEEGVKNGLGLIPMEFERFHFFNENDQNSKRLTIPHMGWDIVEINPVNKDSVLLVGINEGVRERYYFVHSYHAVCADISHVLMTCDYGYKFPVCVQRGNIFGVQFHPEKSHQFGMKLLRNFLERV